MTGKTCITRLGFINRFLRNSAQQQHLKTFQGFSTVYLNRDIVERHCVLNEQSLSNLSRLLLMSITFQSPYYNENNVRQLLITIQLLGQIIQQKEVCLKVLTFIHKSLPSIFQSRHPYWLNVYFYTSVAHSFLCMSLNIVVAVYSRCLRLPEHLQKKALWKQNHRMKLCIYIRVSF